MTTLTEALAPKSDQLNADDLIPGPRTITITDVRIVKDGRQTRITLNYDGDNGKPFKPCKTMGRAMVMAWGITDDNEKQMIGKSIRVFRDPDVKFGDQGAIGGVRISHMSHLDKPAVMKLTVSQGKKAAFTFYPLATEQKDGDRKADPATAWTERYLDGVDLCETLEDLLAFENQRAAKLAELKDKRLDLWERATQAAQVKAGALSKEGKPETDTGDGFDDDAFGGDQ